MTINEIKAKYVDEVKRLVNMNGTSDENIAALRKLDELRNAFLAEMKTAGHTEEKAYDVWINNIMPRH